MDVPSIVVPPVISDHKIIRQIGEGSYGQVWLARTQMGSFRAVKVVYGERFGNDERPFARELSGLRRFEPISRSHPGLVAILQIGFNETEAYFYYVMELADDRRLGAEINPDTYTPRTLASDAKPRERLPVKDCIELGLALASAVHEIHQHGLVHRDIKPSNIIFVKGVAKLADIGLVADSQHAKTYVGTEGFIAPEGPGSPQGDIYSLGKLLYEVSTGKDRTDFPTLPPDLAESGEFLELNEVLVKACDANRKARYQTAKEMEADLALLKGGESVRRLRLLERWFARLKTAAIVAAVFIPLLALVYLQINYRYEKAAQIRQLQLGGHLADGTYALNRGDYAGSLSPYLSAAMLETGDDERAQTHRLRLRAILERCPKLVQMFFHDQPIVDHAEFSSSENFVVTTINFGKAQVWNAQTAERISGPFASSNALESASFSPDEKYVVTADKNGVAEVWETLTGKSILKLVHKEMYLNSARFNPDGKQIVLAGGGGIARVWDFPSGTEKAVLTNHAAELTYAGYSRDGRWLVTTAKDNTAIIWDGHTFKVNVVLPHKQWVQSAGFSPDGRYVVTASFDRQARLWEAQTGEQLFPEMAHGDGVQSARFSPDGRYIVTACLDWTVRVWDATTRQLIAFNAMIHHGDRVLDASFSRDGHRILAACADGTARIWDLAGGAPTPVSTTDFYSADGSLVDLKRAQGFNVKVLSRNGKFSVELNSIGKHPTGCISEDGRRAVVYSRKTAEIYDLQTRKQMYAPLKATFNIAGATFSLDGKYIAIYGGSVAEVREVESGTLMMAAPAREGKVRYADFSSDGRKLVVCTTGSGFEKCSAQIWSIASGTPLSKPLQHGDGVLMAAFSPNGRWVVTASEDFNATVWETATGNQLFPSLHHDHKVLFASFSHNGRWLVTGSADDTVRLWDAATGKPLAPPLPLPQGKLSAARFVEDEAAVFVTTLEGHAWLWRLTEEPRPLEDLAWLYELVGGRGDVDANRFRTSSQERLKQAWTKFTKQNPEDFKLSPSELSAWQR